MLPQKHIINGIYYDGFIKKTNHIIFTVFRAFPATSRRCRLLRLKKTTKKEVKFPYVTQN